MMKEPLPYYTNASSTKRIARNTLMLYFRQMLIMAVNLYTVRVMLNTLGAEDYGIYNVVAGVVTMFGFVNNAMATASQRYLSFALGQDDGIQLKRYFSMSLTIHCLIALAVVGIAETAGLWLVEHNLVIPAQRQQAVIWIYQASIFSTMCTMLTAPFMAAIIAHEDMDIYAYVSIVEVGLKLGIACILPLFATDRLILYSLLMALIVLVTAAIYSTICVKRYAECRGGLLRDKALFKEMSSYTGWNMFGSASGVLKNQMVNIILNQFFSLTVNTARGIAYQVNGAVSSFAQNFTTAVRPQIIKSYASGERDRMLQFMSRSCKATLLLMYIFALPLILEMPYVLHLWLKEVPEHAVLFTRLALSDALLDSVSYPLMAAAQATGRVRLYQSVVGGVLLLNAPAAYTVLRWGGEPHSVFAVSIGITMLAFVVRLLILRHLIDLSFWNFIRRILLPLVSSVAIAAIVPCLARKTMAEGFLRLCVTTAISVASVGTSGYFVALSKSERVWMRRTACGRFGRRNKRT